MKKKKEFMIIYFGPTDHAYYTDIYVPILEEYIQDANKLRVFHR